MTQSRDRSRTLDPRTAAHVALGVVIAGQPVGTVLQRVAQVSKDTIPGVDEASVTLMKGGRARSVAFTGPLAVQLDERQYDDVFGPCLDAAVSGGTIVIPDTATESTYREFARAAVRQGVTHTLSMGLPIGTSSVGGLNLYGLRPGPYDEAAVELAGVLAGYAAIAVANAAALADAVEEIEGLRAAMLSRAVIEQAKGILMRDRRCTADEAFRMLVSTSNRSNRKLRDVAAEVVDGAQR